MVESVRDRAGLLWTVRRYYLPWWPVMQPVTMIMGRPYRWRSVELPLRRVLRRAGTAGRPSTAWKDDAADAVWRVVNLPGRILQSVGMLLLVPPVALIEYVALGLAGCVLSVLRSLGLAQHRIEVVCATGHRTHSVTVLLVAGNTATVDALMADLADRLWDAQKPFRPTGLPANVEVRSHRSAWQQGTSSSSRLAKVMRARAARLRRNAG